jgi:hypothetical protein
VDQLREIQAERRHQEKRDLEHAAAILELHKRKGIPYEPAQDGFVFSTDRVEAFAAHLIRLNESRHIEHVLFHGHQQPITNPAVDASGIIKAAGGFALLSRYHPLDESMLIRGARS